MADRYYSENPIEGEQVRLAGQEAQHLIHVMRAKPGMSVVLFDGSGAEFPAVVDQVGRTEVDLSVTGREPIDRELPINLTLAVGLPKGDRQKWLVEKAVELGVWRVVPLRTTRGVAQPVQQALDRLRRTVVEASKQCGRNRLMEVAEPAGFDDFVEATTATPFRLLAHPQGYHKGPDPLGAASLPRPVLLAVGPEGGFTKEEVSLAVAAGWHTIDLGPRILRIETAALMMVAMVVHHCGAG